jgi:hypothetical protein
VICRLPEGQAASRRLKGFKVSVKDLFVKAGRGEANEVNSDPFAVHRDTSLRTATVRREPRFHL